MAGVEKRIATARAEASHDEPGTTVVFIEGELDLSSVSAIEIEIEKFMDPTPARIVFELSAVTFMDSSGIAMLLRIAERVSTVAIRKPSSSVRLIMGATGLTEILEVEP
jgi:anti-anti-sigma factor